MNNNNNFNKDKLSPIAERPASPLVLSDNNILLVKRWLSFEDICTLYGNVSKKHLWEIRQRFEVTYSKHPLNLKEYIYLFEDMEARVNQFAVYKRDY